MNSHMSLTLNKSDLSRVYDIFSVMDSQPECLTCRQCEENVGLVYVLGSEVQTMEKLQIPLLQTYDGIMYIVRGADGWCTCYNPEDGTCKIYWDRPLCCRIYPLDLEMIDNQLWWVIHKDCPISERFFMLRQFDLLCSLTIDLEKALTDEEISEWIVQDKTSKRIEYISFEQVKTRKLRPFRKFTISP